MNESKRTGVLCRELEAIGAITLPHYAGNIYSSRGWPDRWICHPTWTGWIEFKGSYGKVSALQRVTANQIWARTPGGVYIVWHGTELIERACGDVLAAKWDGTARGLLQVLSVDRARAMGEKLGAEGCVHKASEYA